MKSIYTFLLSFLLISCSLMQPKSVRNSNIFTEKEISAITNLIGKEKIAKDVYENFYAQYQNNLFGNIAKRKQKHIDIWKNILAKQNITVDENDALAETENLKNQLISEGIDEVSALKTAVKIEEMNLADIGNLIWTTSKKNIRTDAYGVECGTRNHLFVFYRAVKEKNGNYTHIYLSGKQFKNIVNGAVDSCGLKYD